MSGESDQLRTAKEVAKAMSSLVKDLGFEPEEASLFPDGNLPTLDTSVWWDGSRFLHMF